MSDTLNSALIDINSSVRWRAIQHPEVDMKQIMNAMLDINASVRSMAYIVWTNRTRKGRWIPAFGDTWCGTLFPCGAVPLKCKTIYTTIRD